MLMTDSQILDAMESLDIIIDPFKVDNLQPVSVDVHLGNEFRWYLPGDEPLRPFNLEHETRLAGFVDGQEFILTPGMFVLAHTEEWVSVSPSVAAWIEGKSTLGRLGLEIHATAGFVDPGFTGQLTLEVSNVNHRPIILTPGMPIAQLAFTRLEQPVTKAYGHRDLRSHYQGQSGATAASPLKLTSR